MGAGRQASKNCVMSGRPVMESIDFLHLRDPAEG